MCGGGSLLNSSSWNKKCGLHTPTLPHEKVSGPGGLGGGGWRAESGRRRCKSNLTRTRALTRDSCPRPHASTSLRNAPSPGAVAAPGFCSRGTPENGSRSPPGRDRGLQKWAQLCKPRLNSPRRGREPLPATQRFPSSDPQTQSTSLLEAAAVAATRARPPPRRGRTPSSPGRGAQPAANSVAAAQYRGAAHTITAPQDRRRAPPGSGVRPAAPGTRGQAHLSGTPRPPECTSSAGAPPHAAAAAAARSHSPAPRPSPLRPGRSRFPAPPSSAPAQEASPPVPLPRTPQPPHPLTAAQRPAAGGGRRPGARKRLDRGDPGRTPYLGGRRGGDGRSGSASERGGRQ